MSCIVEFRNRKGLKVKKTIFLFMVGLLLAAVSIPAQNRADVKLKFNRQDGLVRIVFEAEETFIQKIKVTTSSSQIRLDFPGPFNLTSQKELPFEIAPADRSLAINIKDQGDTKIFRLSSPARLVLDIGKKEAQTVKQPQTKETEKQAEKPAEKQPALIMSKVFTIDAGHGGYDFGITFGNTSEKDVSLSVAKDLGAALSKKGKKVFLLRRVDQHIPLMERIDLVNQKSPDVFISLHASLSKNFVLYSPKLEEQAANETVALYGLSMKQKKYAGKSKTLSDCIEKTIKEEFKGEVIRREMPLPLINSVGAPAVFLEVPSPRFVVYDQRMKTRVTNAIMNGIALYGQ
jgi:N-acetylmuramoyl-L-alanine amidase